MNEPNWLIEVRKEIGQRETKGPASNPRIDQSWRNSKLSGLVGRMIKSYGAQDL